MITFDVSDFNLHYKGGVDMKTKFRKVVLSLAIMALLLPVATNVMATVTGPNFGEVIMHDPEPIRV